MKPQFILGMPLKHDWKRVAKHAWSIRLMAAAAVVSGFETAFMVLMPYLPWAPAFIAGLGFILTSSAIIARLLAQKNFKDSD